ncbi:MAG: cytochrome c biogenesis protein ResB, partial [Campylobacter sp.]|nr:cytochrome c biogenesis protein ResB [Campylobacter sp.]
MKFIWNLSKIFLSYKFIIFMLSILAIGAAVATFIESIYDTQTAKILVYDAFWYEMVMLILNLSLIGIILKTKMWRRFSIFTLHIAFIIVFFGAFLTRYFGQEGLIHIRENETRNEMISVRPYFQIKTQNDYFEYPLNLSQIGNNDFAFTQNINGKNFIVKFNSYAPAPKGERSTLIVEANFDGEPAQMLKIKGGTGWISEPVIVSLDGIEIGFSWGSKFIELPFSLKLLDFELERYAGSQSPSSYASDVEILKDEKSVTDYKIFMNHPLTYEGFKFFQSSYDMDEQGSVLEVNKDPGKIPTYIGYFLFCIGFLSLLFTAQSRFGKLSNFIKNSNFLIIFALLFFINLNLHAADDEALSKFARNSHIHANGEFAGLLVQDYTGKISPLSTEAYEIVNKISGTDSLFNL